MHNLMIVDDSNIIRRKITRAQTNSTFNVVATAENGEQAVAMFKQHQPDVVTMDLTMPEMDGLDCIDQIMAINPNANILVVSALSDKATGLSAITKGARGFLCKPFNDDELIDALAKVSEPVS
ncbi:MAG: response regulator [Pseudomonadales bacterium]|nr:response regulator [Pseudomonadales bacterium]